MSRGRDRELTKEEVLTLMKSGSRPVWTASQIAEHTGVSKTTAKNRLKELSKGEKIDSVKVSNATAYYVVGIETEPNQELSDEERARRLVKEYWEGRLVGGVKDMSCVYTHDGEKLTSGDKAYLVVYGGDFKMTHRLNVISYEEEDLDKVPPEGEFTDRQIKRNDLFGDISSAEVGIGDYKNASHALLTAELGSKFAVPLVEEKLGRFFSGILDFPKETKWKFKDEEKNVSYLTVAGTGAYLLRPWEDAVFLKNVEVIDMDLSDDSEDEEERISEIPDTEDIEEKMDIEDLLTQEEVENAEK
ncbi:MAG: HTH domain-containing protein [Halobacteria archaeon]|nr:HTH domain-containing protein [Halobacteria archaeon]